MTDKEPATDGAADPQSIPESVQNLSLDTIVDAGYEVAPFDSMEQAQQPARKRVGRQHPPGRTPFDDSIDSSSEDPDRTSQGFSFSAGYDSPAATRIGKEGEDDGKRLRELNEGRHRSDGRHSIRESRRDKERIPQAICSALDLSKLEQRKVKGVVQQLDFDRFGHQRSIDRVTLGVVAVLVDERLRQSDSYDDLVSRSDEFQNACDALDVSMSDLSTIKKEVRAAFEEWAVFIPQGEMRVKRDPDLSGPALRSELPDAYWDSVPPERWAWEARRWDSLAESQREAIPEEYRERIMQLRRWEPWNLGREDSEDTAEGPPESEPPDEEHDESARAVAEALIEEMEDAGRE